MKRFLAVVSVSCAAALLASCGQQSEMGAAAETPPPSDTAERAAAPESPAAPAAPVTEPMAEPVADSGSLAAPGAPAFAILYPGATLDSPAVIASSPAGPGGLATYTTQAAPDDVIAFHREHAETAGLSSAMAMNQGDARAYGAANPSSGASLQVVASASGSGSTSVQLSWSAGR